MRKIIISTVAFLALNSISYAGMQSSSSVSEDALKAVSSNSDVNAQLEKIYDGVRTFHIFKYMYGRWGGTSTFTTLVTGQNGFPVFSPRSDKDPKFTEYPIHYNSLISRYHPVRPPESVKNYYSDNNVELGNKDTATYYAPIVAAGTIGNGRVMAIGSHLYASILVNPRNYSSNPRNSNKTDEPDSPDMQRFFENVFAWLTEQNPDHHYSKTGEPLAILSNKNHALFWHWASYGYKNDAVDFKISDKFNVNSDANPKYVPTWREAKANGDLDPKKYPLIILEDIEISNSWVDFANHFEVKTKMEDVEDLVNYVRAGGGLLIMESPHFLEKYQVTDTAANEILKKAGVTTYFANNHQDIALLPYKKDAGGVGTYDMCVADYIGYTDLQRRLEMDDYSNVPQTLDGLKDLLEKNGKLVYLEEVLKRRERTIFKEGNETNSLSNEDCGSVEVELSDGNKTTMQTQLVKGDGIPEQGEGFDLYANYPVDLNFVEAQGDVGGTMNRLLSHELGKAKLSKVDLDREYTNMSALLINDAVFSGEKFKSLNELLDMYKPGGKFVNSNGEFYPGFSFSKKEVLDYRQKPVTRIMLARAFYDKALRYDPSEFPGQSVSGGSELTATIYKKYNTNYQKWYAGNMQSTGLYAPAHESVTVTLPDGMDPAKTQIIVGVGDDVTGIYRHEINLKRPPRYVKKYKFINGNKSLTFTHPYGGLIFVKSFDTTADENATANISFTNVQKELRFVLGKTTAQDWESIKASATAPKAELESHHFIVTVPKANMASLSFDEVTKIAQDYDKMARNAYDFYGYDQTCQEPFTPNTPPSCDNDLKAAHKIRVVFDPHISIGAGHSGYPIMVMNWKPSSASFPQDATKSFLLWHEGGHNMVENWLTIAGSTEVANNVMASYQDKLFNSKSRSLSAVGRILAKGQPWADGGNAGRLLMFLQLPRWIDANDLADFKAKNPKYYNADGSVKAEYPFLKGDGFDVYKIMHREARDKTAENDKYDVCMKSEQGSHTKTDMLAICTSAILEKDTSKWLTAWKAGVVGIGQSGGQNIYDATGGLSSDLTINYDAPTPSIENFNGN